MDKTLKNSTPGNWSRLYLNNWAVPNRRDKVWKDANSFFYWCFHCRRRSRCLRSLMHCIRFWNLFKIWRVLEATYLKLHGKKKVETRISGHTYESKSDISVFAICTSPIIHLVCAPLPPPTPKFYISFVFHFSWVLQLSQKKLMTMFMHNFGGQTRYILG